MRALVRTLVVALICLAVASPAEAARRGPSREKLQQRADKAAARHDRAVTVLSKLDDDIKRLERKLGTAEKRIKPLRAAVTRRAVAVYTSDRGIAAVSGFSTGDNLVESARGAMLASMASAADYAAIQRIADATADIARKRDQLAARKGQQQRVADELRAERQNIDKALAYLERREQALQARLVPRARASRAERAPYEPASGPIPVVTDFTCPLRGPHAFTNSWGAPRGGGRRHEGTDMMAAHGTPNVAVVSGTIRTHHSRLGGLSIYLTGDDGHTYYYAHLSKVVGPDRRVAQGEVIGLVGSTGDATSPHLHFEFHPNGGRAAPSFALLRAHC